jgi:rSAM/selenodomain-associated transferase 1
MNAETRECLILFLKYPQQGEVKTRLAKDIGDGLTLGLYECFIRDMLDKLGPLPYSLHLFVTPSDKMTAMRQWLGKDVALHPQEGHDLGVRMQKAFEEMFRQGYESCVLIGCDFPDLPAAVLPEAFEKLKSAEAVIGPTKDGGYYLLGFRRSRFCKSVFHNIEWSTDTVFEKTMAAFKRENVRVAMVRQWWDVDDPEDLENFFERNKTGNFRFSRTMKFLLQHERQVLKNEEI